MGVLLDQVDAAYDELRQLSCDEVGSDFRLVIAERLENQQRANRGLMYLVFSQIADPPDETGMAVGMPDRLWARLRIPPREIKRRFKLAKRICPRRQLAGPPLPADLAEVGAAVERGLLGEDHLKAIRTALDRLPANVSVTDRDDVQASLVRQAVKGDADIVTAVGRRIDEIFNPDGHFSEEDRARRRGLRLGPQDCDGMSWLSGWIDPETRCYVEAISAAVRPGRHLADGTVEAVPDERSGAQRCHDGIKLGLKHALASGELGSHRGHAVTVIVRTTLAELNQAGLVKITV